jgi:hypothetical protein
MKEQIVIFHIRTLRELQTRCRHFFVSLLDNTYSNVVSTIRYSLDI